MPFGYRVCHNSVPLPCEISEVKKQDLTPCRETADPSWVGVEEIVCFAHDFKSLRRIRPQTDSLAVRGLIDAVISFHDVSYGPSW
jgi:hypothetical protein